MKRLLVICGPTATGKTSLGVELAKKFTGEIVSADSRQVYQGMNIATGKDLDSYGPTPVWLLNVVKPNQEFSAAQYIDLARKVINDIWKRKKLPILVGGTGFYIKGLIDGIESIGVPPNWEMRRSLEKLPIGELFEMLAELDSSRAASLNASDRKNPRRLIRAIEVSQKKPKLKAPLSLKPDYFLVLGLMAPLKRLYQQIDKRIDEQVKMGAEREIKQLLAQGYTWELPAMTAMGYGVWRPYFEKKTTKEKVMERWKFAEHAYARRQMTWFKKDKLVHWYDITQKGWKDGVESLVNKWYDIPNAKEN